MRVLISGAGIAGLTMAYWLCEAGHQPVVIEKAEDLRTEGYMIDFGGTGWDVAERMGIIETLKQYQHHIDMIKYKNKRGATTAEISLSMLYEAGNVQGKFMVINRRDLVRVLYDTVRERVPLRFATTIKRVCQSADHVSVTFNDDSQAEFDLLVGADGIHSQVRELVFGPEALFARYLGYRFAVWLTPRLDYDLHQSYQMYVEPDYQYAVYPFSNEQWMALMVDRHPSGTIPAPAERAEQLRSLLPQDTWILGQLRAHLTAETRIFMDTVTQIQLPSWSQQRVVLIGDAAYCPTLVSGQGASMAMAGAYFLARELQQAQALQQACARYEQRLRPHIEKIHAAARRFAPSFVPKQRWNIWVIQAVLRLAHVPLVKQLIGKRFAVESIIEAAA